MKKMVFLLLLLILFPSYSLAAENQTMKEKQIFKQRLELYKKMQAATNIPWYYYAGLDQYERNLRLFRKDLPKPKGAISIWIPPEKWSGLVNPNREDTNPKTIAFFNGYGVDGNGDGKADRNNDEDLLAAIGQHFLKYGTDEDNIRIALWTYYKRDKAVSIIMEQAKIYKVFNHFDLYDRAFPIPLNYNYSYKSTWGDRRGWGGRRIHEGTDIFADYGVPVRSTCYGIVEMKGWNRYGGWRIGIRDVNNTYHYFAHLSGFSKNLKVGKVVKPGTVIGGVGSTGYGPPGTAGKFPPHLHYGMYKDTGTTDYSFDPYPHLKQWERMERLERKKNNS